MSYDTWKTTDPREFYNEPSDEDDEVELTPYQAIARKHPELMHREILMMLTPSTDEDCPF